MEETIERDNVEERKKAEGSALSQPISQWNIAGQIFGLLALIGLCVLTFSTSLDVLGPSWASLATLFMFIGNYRLVIGGTGAAFDMFHNDPKKFTKNLAASAPINIFKKIIIFIIIPLLAISTGFGFSLGVASSALALGFPPTLAAIFLFSTLVSISATLFVALSTLVRASRSDVKTQFKQLFYPHEDNHLSTKGDWARYALQLTLTLTLLGLGISLGILSALGPLGMLHGMGLALIQPYFPTHVMFVHAVCFVVFYGAAGFARLSICLVSAAHQMNDKVHGIYGFIENPMAYFQAIGQATKTNYNKSYLDLIKYICSTTFGAVIWLGSELVELLNGASFITGSHSLGAVTNLAGVVSNLNGSGANGAGRVIHVKEEGGARTVQSSLGQQEELGSSFSTIPNKTF